MSGQTSILDQVKNDYLTKLKKVELAGAGIDINHVSDYVSFINADNEEEIKKQAKTIAADALGKPVPIEKDDKKIWTIY